MICKHGVEVETEEICEDEGRDCYICLLSEILRELKRMNRSR